MDYNLYVILQQDCLDKIGIYEKKAHWGDENISYIPKRFMFEDKMYFVAEEIHISSATESCIKENQVMLKLTEGLRELEWDVNRNQEQLKSNDIIKILRRICNLNIFSIIILEDDQVIEQQIEYDYKNDILDLICLALDWKNFKSVEIFHK